VIDYEALDGAIGHNWYELDPMLTDRVKANGLGLIAPARLATAIEQTKSVYSFTTPPDAALYFDASYLPTDGSRKLQ